MAVILVSASLSSCETWSDEFPAEYQIVDDLARGGFAMSYTNRSAQPVCLSPTQWPNGQGSFDVQDGSIFVRIGDKTYPAKHNNGGYCPGCATRIEPRQTIHDFVPYDRFHLPSELWLQPKQMEFGWPLKAYGCVEYLRPKPVFSGPDSDNRN